MEASIDTNVLARFALKDIPDQFDAALALLDSPTDHFVVADAVFIELAYVLERHYNLGRGDVCEFIRSLLTIDSLVANSAVIIATCLAYEAHPRLSFADCYLAEHAQFMQVTPLFTFDKKLATQHPATQLVPPAGHSKKG
ncbi:MAG: PIN domain-containing protein [Propionibacteriaceae bacterium]|jgi:predicted nucleic-acid-binding protein|nr:PIN domain-containing protein [Propionibacteriaceae bacterium]